MCRRVYKSESEYKRHYKVHTTEFQEYTCTTCGKSSSTKKNLDEHMTLHRDILRFQCESCGKKFRWHYSLSIHMKCKHPPTPPPPSDCHGKSPNLIGNSVRKLSRLYTLYKVYELEIFPKIAN